MNYFLSSSLLLPHVVYIYIYTFIYIPEKDAHLEHVTSLAG